MVRIYLIGDAEQRGKALPVASGFFEKPFRFAYLDAVASENPEAKSAMVVLGGAPSLELMTDAVGYRMLHPRTEVNIKPNDGNYNIEVHFLSAHPVLSAAEDILMVELQEPERMTEGE